jgi:hypothetical protein
LLLSDFREYQIAKTLMRIVAPSSFVSRKTREGWRIWRTQ